MPPIGGGVGDLGQNRAICGPPIERCEADACPSGTRCRVLYRREGTEWVACVAPGGIGLRGLCAEDDDCRAPYRCVEASSDPLYGYSKMCL
ncbi:MAG: hypothetical protein RMK74_17275 [Myxococcales bacterium]|nr:hypothetical protein [Myxococcales bacterium]